ncbi:hypothetical protein MANES_02G204625v8 [Manihot esculenta]|uniref:Uncharacterized protein n=1 Tax=Manihot esculenta TaxID=3983 RepID=A0ACB7I7V6_MANES|nr:hypothetical protein MANES_02G204625v8 [Manihot esculenta]
MWQYSLEMPASHNESSSPEAKHVHKLSFLGKHMYNSSQFTTCILVDSKSRTHYPYHYPIHSRCNTPTETPSHHQKHPIINHKKTIDTIITSMYRKQQKLMRLSV